MLRRVADHREDQAHRARKIFLVRQPTATVGCSGSLAVFVVHIDQVDVAGDVQFARAQLAHADHPETGPIALCRHRRAVAAVQFGEGLGAGHVEREFSQSRDAVSDRFQRLLRAVQHDQAVHHQLPQDAQAHARQMALRAQRPKGIGQGGVGGRPVGQQRQHRLVAPLESLKEARAGLRQSGCGRRGDGG